MNENNYLDQHCESFGRSVMDGDGDSQDAVKLVESLKDSLTLWLEPT